MTSDIIKYYEILDNIKNLKVDESFTFITIDKTIGWNAIIGSYSSGTNVGPKKNYICDWYPFQAKPAIYSFRYKGDGLYRLKIFIKVFENWNNSLKDVDEIIRTTENAQREKNYNQRLYLKDDCQYAEFFEEGFLKREMVGCRNMQTYVKFMQSLRNSLADINVEDYIERSKNDYIDSIDKLIEGVAETNPEMVI